MVRRPRSIDAALPDLLAPVSFIQTHLRSKHLKQTSAQKNGHAQVFKQDYISKLNVFSSSRVFMLKERTIDQIRL